MITKRISEMLFGLFLTTVLAATVIPQKSVAQALRPAGKQILSIAGNSLNEKKAQWIWQLLPLVIKACRALPSCQMTTAENQILDQIISNLPYYGSDSLQFENESQNPGKFTSDQNEAHRIAVTGNIPQSKIFLNLDRLDTLGWSQMLAILGHETVHHAGIIDDENRLPDQIGAKLGRYFELNSIASSLEEQGHPEIQALYFGVSVPETTDYFQIFPVPTVSVHAKTAVMDEQNIYDIDSFDSYSPFHCYSVPGSALVNEQVTNPKIHVNRWFQGDSEVSVSMNVQLRSVCLILAHAPDADMKASYAVGQTSLQLVLEDPSVNNWQQSRLKIRGPFIRATFRPSADQENPEIAQFAKVEKVVSAPASVIAGQTYKLQILVRMQDSSATLICDAPFNGESWHSLDMTSLVPFRNFDRCQAQKQSQDLYLVSLEEDIPGNAFAGYYGVETLGLVKSKTGELVTAALPQKIIFQILNPQTPAPMKILSFQFLNVGNGKLVPDKIYDFEVRIENAKSIYSSFVSGRFFERSGHHLDFMEEIAHSTNSMFRLSGYRTEGNILIASYKARIPGPSQNASVDKIELYTFSYHTENFGEAYLDLRQKPAVFEIANK
ncbi:MAG: hypothetical protein ACXWC9_01410 [Pseudobdellovibrionaceae bacterium]